MTAIPMTWMRAADNGGGVTSSLTTHEEPATRGDAATTTGVRDIFVSVMPTVGANADDRHASKPVDVVDPSPLDTETGDDEADDRRTRCTELTPTTLHGHQRPDLELHRGRQLGSQPGRRSGRYDFGAHGRRLRTWTIDPSNAISGLQQELPGVDEAAAARPAGCTLQQSVCARRCNQLTPSTCRRRHSRLTATSTIATGFRVLLNANGTQSAFADSPDRDQISAIDGMGPRCWRRWPTTTHRRIGHGRLLHGASDNCPGPKSLSKDEDTMDDDETLICGVPKRTTCRRCGVRNIATVRRRHVMQLPSSRPMPATGGRRCYWLIGNGLGGSASPSDETDLVDVA